MENVLERLKALPKMFEELAWVFRSFAAFAAVVQNADTLNLGFIYGKLFLSHADFFDKLAMEILENERHGDPLKCINTIDAFFGGLLRAICDSDSHESSFNIWNFDIWKKEVLPKIDEVGNEAVEILKDLRELRMQKEGRTHISS